VRRARCFALGLLRLPLPAPLGPGALRRGKVHLAYEDSRRNYGYRRVRAELVDAHGETVSRHQVARLMKRTGIQGVIRRKFCRTMRRDDRARPAPDLLDRDFSATGSDQR